MQNDRTFRPFARMLVKIYRKMGIMSNNDLHLILYRTRDDPDLEVRFVNEFDEASGGYGITHKRVCFLGSTVMYMNMWWNYDHEYFQRMIKRDTRMNPEVVGENIDV